MHLGNMATIGHHGPPNFKHIVINNGAHDSVGGQPTDAEREDEFRITQVALGVGYKQVCHFWSFKFIVDTQMKFA